MVVVVVVVVVVVAGVIVVVVVVVVVAVVVLIVVAVVDGGGREFGAPGSILLGRGLATRVLKHSAPKVGKAVVHGKPTA